MMLMQFVLTFPFPNIQQWWWNKNKKCLHENFAPLAHHCGHLKLESKYTQSTKGQKHPEIMRPQDPRAEGALRVAVLLTKHRECSICYEPFSADTGATDENIIERLPVQSATCRHYFCLGCILRIHAQKATSSFGVVPE